MREQNQAASKAPRLPLGVTTLSVVNSPLSGLTRYAILNKMYYVYILFSEKDKRLYTGFTPNLRSRFKAHSEGFVKSTKHRRPLKLIYYESYHEESDARRREMFLKGGNGKSQLKVQLSDILKTLDYKHLNS